MIAHIGLLVKSFGRVRNVFGTCVGRCVASATDKMVTQQARRSPFCVLSSILHPYSHCLARLPPSSRTYLIVCSHGSCTRSLARFLPASPTHSIANLFSVFFPPTLPPSFTNWPVCLLSPSFIPFNSSLDFNLPPTHTHSHTHFLASSLLDKYFTRSLSLLSLLTRLLAFRLTLSLTYSLNNLLTHSIVPSFIPSITSLLACFLINSLSHGRFPFSSLLYPRTRLFACFVPDSLIQFFSLFACFFSPVLIHLFAFSFTRSCALLFGLPNSRPLSSIFSISLTLSRTHLKLANSLIYSLIRSLSYFMLTCLSFASSFTKLLFAHSLAFLSPYSLTCSIACFLPPPLLTHWPVHLLAASLPSSLFPSFICSLTYLLACLHVPCLHPSLVTTLVCSVVSFFLPPLSTHSFVRLLCS